MADLLFVYKIKKMKWFTAIFIIFVLGCTNGSLESSGSGGSSKKRVFVTSNLYLVTSLGGLSGADNLCQTSANSAGLGGNFKAWLSGSLTAANSRVSDVSPWYRIDRTTLVFSSYPSATSLPLVTLNVDEYGNTVGSNNVWTHTNPDGSINTSNTVYHCNEWTTGGTFGHVGSASLLTSNWTGGASNLSCSVGTARLYCFEQ